MPTCMRYAQPMTDELFREDAALDTCDARITILGEAGHELDRTVFYPQGGGQAGDRRVRFISRGFRVAQTSGIRPRLRAAFRLWVR